MACAHLGMQRDQRRRALLHHLLMAALDGALALAQVDHVAVAVAEDLDFDVARALDQLLDVDFGVAEGALGFAGGVAERGFELALRDPRGACPCRRRRPRPSAGSGSRGCARELAAPRRGDGVIGAGHHGRARGDGGAARGGLRAHGADGRGRGADEDDAGVLAGGGEIGVLAEEAVAGMDGLGAVLAGGVEDAVDAQVAFGGGRRARRARLRRPCGRAARCGRRRSRRPRWRSPSRAGCA